MLTIEKLQKALMIINKDGAGGYISAYHEELQIEPKAVSFSATEVAALLDLGFTMDDEGIFWIYT